MRRSRSEAPRPLRSHSTGLLFPRGRFLSGVVAQGELHGGLEHLKIVIDLEAEAGQLLPVLLGEDEIKEGKVSLKNMESGEQAMYTVEEAAELVKSTVSSKSRTKCVTVK